MSQKTYTGTMEVTEDSIVGEVLEKVPGSLDVLVDYGFTPLKNPIARRLMAGTMTIGQACKMKSVDKAALLADLNMLPVVAHPETAAAGNVRG